MVVVQNNFRRASPSTTDLDGGGTRTKGRGGAAHGLGIVVCVAPLPPHIYIGGGEGGSQEAPPRRPNPPWAPALAAAHTIFAGGGKEGGRGRQGQAESPSFLFSPWPAAIEGARQPLLCWCAPLTWPIWPIYLLGVLGTPSGDPVSPGTLSVSEYSLPIYESLPLDHFETPRHVRDLIRDSEQT